LGIQDDWAARVIEQNGGVSRKGAGGDETEQDSATITSQNFDRLSIAAQQQIREFRKKDPQHWQVTYRNEIRSIVDTLMQNAVITLENKGVEFEKITDDTGRVIQLKITAQRDEHAFNVYAAKMQKSKGLSLVYDPNLLFDMKAGALYGRDTKTIYLSHDSISTASATEQIYHEKVHSVLDRIRDEGGDSIVFGRAKLNGGQFSLDEYVTYSEMLNRHSRKLEQLMSSPTATREQMLRCMQEITEHAEFFADFNKRFASLINSADFAQAMGNIELVREVRKNSKGQEVYFLVGKVTINGESLALDLGSANSAELLPTDSAGSSIFQQKISTWQQVTDEMAAKLAQLENSIEQSRADKKQYRCCKATSKPGYKFKTIDISALFN
jgi:hypothetical protein